MHWNEESCPETVYKLPCALRISVPRPAVHRKHHYVKAVRDFQDILQLPEVKFLFPQRVDEVSGFRAADKTAPEIIRQETGIPVVQVSRMENPPAPGLHNPGYTAVVASGSRHTYIPILPSAALGKPDVRISFLRTPVPEDVLGQYIDDFRAASIRTDRPSLAPPENLTVEMILMEMAGKDIHRLGR